MSMSGGSIRGHAESEKHLEQAIPSPLRSLPELNGSNSQAKTAHMIPNP